MFGALCAPGLGLQGALQRSPVKVQRVRIFAALADVFTDGGAVTSAATKRSELAFQTGDFRAQFLVCRSRLVSDFVFFDAQKLRSRKTALALQMAAIRHQGRASK